MFYIKNKEFIKEWDIGLLCHQHLHPSASEYIENALEKLYIADPQSEQK